MQDIEYLKSMYPSGIKILQGYVSEACDRLDYKNSPMYDEYPDHLMINRLCDSIYNTVISSEGPERVQSMWNITEADKSALEMAELKKDMQRLDIIPDYSDQGPDNNMVKAQDHNSEHIAESTSIRAVNTGGNGSRSSLLKNSNEFDNGFNVHSLEEKMEIQEMRGKEMARTQGGRPPMGPGQGQERPPMGPGPERPPMGPGQGQGRPPMGPGSGKTAHGTRPGPGKTAHGTRAGETAYGTRSRPGKTAYGTRPGPGKTAQGPGPERPPRDRDQEDRLWDRVKAREDRPWDQDRRDRPWDRDQEDRLWDRVKAREDRPWDQGRRDHPWDQVKAREDRPWDRDQEDHPWVQVL